jgi:glutathione S-transferase
MGNKRFSSWSLRPYLAMKIAGLAFDETTVRLRQPDTKERISALSPSGKVPALIVEEDGKRSIVWDSLAICETLAERHPECALWPKDAARRAEARAIVAEMHSGFPDIRKILPMDVVERHPTPELSADVRNQIERVKAIWLEALQRYASDGGFLFGAFSLADAFYAPVVTRFDTYEIRLSAVAQAYSQRILALSPMREWVEAARAEPRELTKS